MSKSETCPTCRRPWTEDDVPPEPPIGTWVKDRHGAAHVRCGNGNWACSPTGFYALARWAAMWKARGPLVECEPYGR